MTRKKIVFTCTCGCGEPVKIGNRFVHGHNRIGEHWPEEMKLQIKQSNLKTYANPEIVAKLSGENNAFFGKKHSKEFCELQRDRALSRNNDPVFLRKHSSATKEALNAPGVRQKIANNTIENWKSADYVEKQKIARAIKPNKVETRLMQLLNKLYPNQWKYTGDFSFMIGGKCPDFVNVNGQKKCIELYGDYWHRGQDPKKRKDIFKEYGWDTLVIWEHELNNEMLTKAAIHGFVRRPICH